MAVRSRTCAVVSALAFSFVLLILAGCGRQPVSAQAKDTVAPGERGSTPADKSLIRSTGMVQAVRTLTIRVPQLAQVSGRNPQLTLTKLVPNGTGVKQGDILVEFDRTLQIDDAREAQAKLDDLQHQLEEKRAQVNSDSTKRMSEIRQAEADLAKANLQLQKGPVLADLDRKKNEVKAASASERLVSLRKSHDYHLKAEVAAVRTLELKCDRQKVVVERLKSNIERLIIHAPHNGMVAFETVWRSGSMGPPQVGDQMWPNQPVLRIFDPSAMIVDAQVNESDFAVLGPGTHAKVFVDAYPNIAFEAQLESASPVATAGLESPVKSFTARFRINDRDTRLMPDLSASLEIQPANKSVVAALSGGVH